MSLNIFDQFDHLTALTLMMIKHIENVKTHHEF